MEIARFFVKSSEKMGGNCESNWISTTLPRTEITVPRFERLVNFCILVCVLSARAQSRLGIECLAHTRQCGGECRTVMAKLDGALG